MGRLAIWAAIGAAYGVVISGFIISAATPGPTVDERRGWWAAECARRWPLKDCWEDAKHIIPGEVGP